MPWVNGRRMATRRSNANYSRFSLAAHLCFYAGVRAFNTSVNPRPDGIFQDPARRWGGGGGSLPLAICQTAGPVLGPKTAFESSGLKLSEYTANHFLNVTDDLTGRVKGFFY